MSLIERALNQVRGTPEGANDPRSARRFIRSATIAALSGPPSRVFPRAEIAPVTSEDSCLLTHLTDDYARRAYKVLRTRVLKRLNAGGWHSIAVTSAAPGEGKSLTAINLALALAQDAATSVFLVDLDLQRPALARYLGMTHGPDLSNYLAGEAPIEKVIYDVGIERLAVLPNSQPLHNSSELLRGDRMAELVGFLEAETPKRVIVYDMPPALVGDDVLAFSDSVDSIMMVVAEGKTSRVALENARNVLGDMNLLGVVLNHASQSKDEAYAYY